MHYHITYFRDGNYKNRPDGNARLTQSRKKFTNFKIDRSNKHISQAKMSTQQDVSQG